MDTKDVDNMIVTTTDIDIDTPNRNKLLSLFNYTTASIEENNKLKKHNTGVYFHKVPVNPFNGLCSIDHKIASDNGFFKIDILNLSIYKNIKSEEHLEILMNKEPLWELLEEKEFCDLLFHIKGHHDICKRMKPRNKIQLAAVMAMIRPAKRYLVGRNWDYVFKNVWKKPTENEAYYFKKSHAVAYANTVVVQMNLLCEELVV